MVLREAAVCCSMAHPNVVATYHFEVMRAAGFHTAPSGLSISDQSGSRAFKLYLIQVHAEYLGTGEGYLGTEVQGPRA